MKPNDFATANGRYVTLDTHTGAILPAVRPLTPKQPKGAPFVRIEDRSLEALTEDKRLTGTDYRVLLRLCRCIDYGGRYLDFRTTDIAEKLDMQAANVSKALRRLTEFGYLIKERDVNANRRWRYRIPEAVAFRGNTVQLLKHQQLTRTARKGVPSHD